MENASKALLIAGGVLISVLIIGLFMYMFTSMSGVFQTKADIERKEEIEKYNEAYLSYNKRLMRGAELITLINKIINSNSKYDDNGSTVYEYEITLEFKLEKDLVAYKKVSYKDGTGKTNYRLEENKSNSLKAGTHAINSKNDKAYKTLFDRNYSEIDTFNDFKRRIFNCTGVEYNKVGRIRKISFTEQEINYGESI